MKLSDFSGVTELKAQLDTHPLYGAVRTIDDLRCFMEHHVFPVWDFMSLVKFLQESVAPAGTPWMPTGNPDLTAAQRFINEIVLGEESDEGLPNSKGKHTFVSHFDLYIGAMEEVGADTRPIQNFLKAVKKHGVKKALASAKIPEPSRRFMTTTFDFLASGKPHLIAAVFAFGREQVIPGMFRALLADIGISKKKAPLFHYYLERHIHLDDEFHGPMSLQLLDLLCGDSASKRKVAEKSAQQAIKARLALWDDVLIALPNKRSK
jgi:hypothetical protein